VEAISNTPNDMAAYLREMAREARAIAAEMADPESKRSMLEIAAGYELLANDSNDADGTSLPAKAAAA
jgi:hypothetical protein